MLGSTESSLIWKAKATPAGRLIFRLAPSTRHTNALGSTGSQWSTPSHHDFTGADSERLLTRQARCREKHSNGNGFGLTTGNMLVLTQWPTPLARDGMPPHKPEYVAEKKAQGHGMSNLNDTMAFSAQWRSPTAGEARGGAYADPAKAVARMASGHTVNLEDQMVAAQAIIAPNGMECPSGPAIPSLNAAPANWSTPRASDGEKGGPNQSFGAGGQPLPSQMHQATWVTPSARDWKDTPGMAQQAGDRSRLDQLPRQMAATTGAMPTGSSATTGKRGARLVPNPVFAMWLMGFPPDLRNTILHVCSSPPSKVALPRGG